MIIRVHFKDEHYIDYENVDSFDINDKRWVLLFDEDGGTVFLNSDKITRFAHIVNTDA